MSSGRCYSGITKTEKRCIMTLQEKFELYHRENPHILPLLVRFVNEAKASGRKHYSINAIFERIRWHLDIETTGDVFKLNNNYRSRYVRLLEKEHPEYDGFFFKRALDGEPRKKKPVPKLVIAKKLTFMQRVVKKFNDTFGVK